jgi:hypothetical protein
MSRKNKASVRSGSSSKRSKLNKRPTLHFVMMELSDPRDCDSRRRVWRSKRHYGYLDVTPVFGERKRVPSLFKKKSAKLMNDAIQCRSKMADTVADWYMLSGHHGRLYGADYDATLSATNWANSLEYAGFFNDDYHHGRWNGASRADPNWVPSAIYTGKTKRSMMKHQKWEIYLSTTKEPDPMVAPFTLDNPLLAKASRGKRQARAKGFILSACNTLTFSHTREAWDAYYPDAVFIGTFRTIAAGTQVTNAIKKTRLCNRAFWEDPSSVLSGPGKAADFAKQLASKFSRSRRGYGLGIMYKKKVYVPTTDSRGRVTIKEFGISDNVYA